MKPCLFSYEEKGFEVYVIERHIYIEIVNSFLNKQ